MQKLIAVIIVMACTTCISVNAGQKANKTQKSALKAELLNKYDVNRDGKLDKSERSKMNKHDKKLARKAGLRAKHAHKSKNK